MGICTRFGMLLLLLFGMLLLPIRSEAEKIKVAFVLLESIRDQGWTQAHYEGIEYLKDKLGDRIEVAYTENIVSPADAERVIRDYAAKGYDIIFGTTFGYMDPMLTVAAEFPDIKFEHCSGYKSAPNMSNYFARMYQGEYLSGYMAGLMGFTNVGTVATQPIPEPIRGINAFTIGLRKGLEESNTAHDPQKLNTVVWMQSWRDPIKETTLAETLVARKHDLIRQMADTPDSAKAACALGTPAVGYGLDASRFGADCALVSPTWNWGPYYERRVLDVINGTWEKLEYWGGIDENMIRLSPFNKSVPQDVRDKVMAEYKRLESGQDDIFNGPIIAQNGDVLFPEGQKPSDGDLLSGRWLIRGVSGNLP